MTAASNAGVWPTTVKVQCRNEPVFEGTIRFRVRPGLGGEPPRLVPWIDCPTCARGYELLNDGTWISDRPLKFISY